MKIMNKSGKLIGIGSDVMLPNSEMIVPANFDGNPVIQHLLTQGKLVLIDVPDSLKINLGETEQIEIAGLVDLPKELNENKHARLTK